MGKKLSHIETFHRRHNYRHSGPGHSLKAMRGETPYGSPWVGLTCVCGYTDYVLDSQLIDDPGACTTCGNALKRFEMFTTSYERCYRCEPAQGTHSTPKESPKTRCWGFWFANEQIGYKYTNEWSGFISREDISELELKEYASEGQYLYCLEWDNPVKIKTSDWDKNRYSFYFTRDNPGVIVEKFEKGEY